MLLLQLVVDYLAHHWTGIVATGREEIARLPSTDTAQTVEDTSGDVDMEPQPQPKPQDAQTEPVRRRVLKRTGLTRTLSSAVISYQKNASSSTPPSGNKATPPAPAADVRSRAARLLPAGKLAVLQAAANNASSSSEAKDKKAAGSSPATPPTAAQRFMARCTKTIRHLFIGKLVTTHMHLAPLLYPLGSPTGADITEAATSSSTS